MLTKETAIIRLTKKLLSLIHSPKTDPKELNLAIQDLLMDLSNIEFSHLKLLTLFQTNEKELEYYHSLRDQRQNSIKEYVEDIEELKKELQIEKVNKQHREEYETILGAIQEFPSRQKTASQLEKVEEEVQQLRDRVTNLDENIQLKAKQFQLFMHSAFELQNQLKDDSSLISFNNNTSSLNSSSPSTITTISTTTTSSSSSSSSSSRGTKHKETTNNSEKEESETSNKRRRKGSD